MRPRPIIFSPDMADAIWHGKKSMTRRLAWRNGFDRNFPGPWQHAPVGCLLYVRESYVQRADREEYGLAAIASAKAAKLRVTPAIHMPLQFSRMTLVIKALKLERLDEITEDDAKLEGFTCRGEFFDKFVDLHGNKMVNANPEVSVITFKANNKNINQYIINLKRAA